MFQMHLKPLKIRRIIFYPFQHEPHWLNIDAEQILNEPACIASINMFAHTDISDTDTITKAVNVKGNMTIWRTDFKPHTWLPLQAIKTILNISSVLLLAGNCITPVV